MTSRFDPVFSFAHAHRRWVAALTYGLATTLSLVLAFVLRFEFTWPEAQAAVLWKGLPWLLAIRTVFAIGFRITSGRWRFVGVSDLMRLIASVMAGTAVYFLLSWVFPVLPRIPRSILLLEAVITQYVVAGIWVVYRMAFEGLQHLRAAPLKKRRVLMVGAGDAGQNLVREMQRTPSGMVPVGYVDDDPVKWSSRIHGVKVLGAVADLTRLVPEREVDELVIAVPSAEPTQIRKIVELCEQAGKPFSILPGLAEVLSGEAHLAQVREVRIEDLLGREPIVMRLPEVRADVSSRRVLITGAAGSIGSELARQVALHRPGTLILADQAETPLYYLDLELRADFPGLDVVPVIANVANEDVVEALFAKYSPDRVFHAAAYKHVPLMQRFPQEAVRNNVLATWIVANAAGRHGAEKFILVSTDKAVRPASIMGASKRVAELAVLEAQKEYPDTAYGAVRFGNVLGSNGSVVPLFRRQLEQGKPLTVTHEAVTRYFMTIPEAVQLILKTALLPELRGHVAMLEMGEPVRILDLAMNFLRLAGNPSKLGENIVLTGLRPGEKLEEELVAPEEHVLDTDLEKVHLVVSSADSQEKGVWLSDEEVQALRNSDVDRVLEFLYQRFPAVRPGVRKGVLEEVKS